MKYILFLCVFVSAICKAQFPAPQSFIMGGGYIPMDESGPCGEEIVYGPGYCTYFSWEAPDLSETEAQLTGYNVYFCEIEYYSEGMEIPFSEAKIIAQTTNTYIQKGIGIIGVVWVTAVYSDPNGESEPSNIEYNTALPTAINEVKSQDVSFYYNKQRNGIEIKGIEDVAYLSIFHLTGIEISIPAISDFIDTKNIEKGIYIINITTKNRKIISDKIIIN